MQDREVYDDVSSPTARTTSIMMVLTIAAHQERAIATADVPGAYLEVPIVEEVLVRYGKQVTELLVAMMPERYGSAVRGDGTIVVRLLKALTAVLRQRASGMNT